MNSWSSYKTLPNPGPNARESLGTSLGEVYGMVFARVGARAYNVLTEDMLLEEAKKMVLKKRKKLVNRLRLSSLVQGGDEAVTSFKTS